MEIDLGSRVLTHDGQDAGTVDKLILDPDSGKVKAVALRQGMLLPRDVEVRLEALERDPDGTLRLACPADDLPGFEAEKYTTPPLDYVAPTGAPSTGLLFPLGYPGPAGETSSAGVERGMDQGVRDEITASLYALDQENAVVGEGATVKSRDGEKVGEVADLRFDAESGRLTHLVMRRGFFFLREADIPAELIESVGDGVVHLKADAAALRASHAA